jgi:PEP-CTERM motif
VNHSFTGNPSMKTFSRELGLVGLILFTTAIDVQAGYMVGSSYSINITNGPNGNVNTNVTLDLTTKTISPNLTVTEKLFADGPDSQWIELDFRTLNGGPLAANFNGHWQFDIAGLDVDTPSLGSGFYFYWSINGTPDQTISPFGGIGGIIPIPTNPGAGPTYSAIGFPPFAAPDFGTFLFVNPYNFINAGGMNPSEVNGFHMGVRISNATPSGVIPEPSSMLIMAGLGLITVVRRQRRA